MAAAWRVAASLQVLLAQLNALFPDRSKVSDGSIGDAAHASRDSDHNPWVKVVLGKLLQGIVTARDFTHDPDGGIDCHWLAAVLVASGDRRIKYVIWDGRIWTPKGGWQVYRGTNAHRHHLHLSVVADVDLFDDETPWALTVRAPGPAPARPAAPAADAPTDVQEDDDMIKQLALIGVKDSDPAWGGWWVVDLVARTRARIPNEAQRLVYANTGCQVHGDQGRSILDRLELVGGL